MANCARICLPSPNIEPEQSFVVRWNNTLLSTSNRDRIRLYILRETTSSDTSTSTTASVNNNGSTSCQVNPQDIIYQSEVSNSGQSRVNFPLNEPALVAQRANATFYVFLHSSIREQNCFSSFQSIRTGIVTNNNTPRNTSVLPGTISPESNPNSPTSSNPNKLTPPPDNYGNNTNALSNSNLYIIIPSVLVSITILISLGIIFQKIYIQKRKQPHKEEQNDPNKHQSIECHQYLYQKHPSNSNSTMNMSSSSLSLTYRLPTPILETGSFASLEEKMLVLGSSYDKSNDILSVTDLPLDVNHVFANVSDVHGNLRDMHRTATTTIKTSSSCLVANSNDFNEPSTKTVKVSTQLFKNKFRLSSVNRSPSLTRDAAELIAQTYRTTLSNPIPTSPPSSSTTPLFKPRKTKRTRTSLVSEILSPFTLIKNQQEGRDLAVLSGNKNALHLDMIDESTNTTMILESSTSLNDNSTSHMNAQMQTIQQNSHTTSQTLLSSYNKKEFRSTILPESLFSLHQEPILEEPLLNHFIEDAAIRHDYHHHAVFVNNNSFKSDFSITKAILLHEPCTAQVCTTNKSSPSNSHKSIKDLEDDVC